MYLKFSGGSDDLIEISGVPGFDEVGWLGSGPWRADVTGPDGEQLRVYVALTDSGCWAVGVGQVDEDYPLPSWPVTIRQDPGCPYSALLEIEAPEGAKLTVVGEGV